MPVLDRDDERQEALIGLLQACRDFDPASGRFGAIATVRVRSRVWTALSSARDTRNRIVTDALRLEHRAGPDEDRMRALGDVLPARRRRGPGDRGGVAERVSRAARTTAPVRRVFQAPL
jgi:Sigma-70 region 2